MNKRRNVAERNVIASTLLIKIFILLLRVATTHTWKTNWSDLLKDSC